MKVTQELQEAHIPRQVSFADTPKHPQLTVLLSYSLYHLFANTQAGARLADKTRQALAFEQLRSRRTHVIAYAGGYFEIFETLSFAYFILQLPASAQERLRHWLDEHLHTVQKRE